MRSCLILLIFVFLNSGACAANSFFIKKAELNRVSSQIQKLKKTITLDQAQQQTLESELQTMEVKIGGLGLQINQINHSITKEQYKLAKLKSTQELTLYKLSEQQAALAQQLRAAYELDFVQPLKVILNQDNPSTVQRHLNYYQRIGKVRIETIAGTKETLSRLRTILLSMTHYQKNLKTLLAKKQTQQQAQKTAQRLRQKLITTLHTNVVSKQQELTTLVANQIALQDIITHLKLQEAEGILGRPFNQLRGKLHWPIQGEIAANYGSLLDVGEQRLNGVILKAPEGTPVHAIANGKVIFATWLRGFGLLIIINHGNNFMSLYGRNHALYAKVGDKVNMGDTIATTGSSGGFEKSSLYFEIRQNGQPINPNGWCG